MKSKYFTVEVNPVIPNVAAGQHAAFADGDVLFNWHAFDIPRGPAKLLSVSCDIRPKGNGAADPNKFALELFFAKSRNNGTDPTALGTVNSAVTVPAFSPNQIISFVEVVAGDFADHLDSTTFSHTVPLAGTIFNGELKPEKGTHVGFDRYYVAGMAGGDLDFTSLTRINNGDLNGPVMTVSGTDPRLFLSEGDTINVTTAAGTSVSKSMGVIKSMTSTSITLEEAFTTGDVVHTDFVYNVAPITIRLHFEK
tara:strand:- start:36 stop:791 length:756 start_codon:yes stop_codon:yes gene_type:complete